MEAIRSISNNSAVAIATSGSSAPTVQAQVQPKIQLQPQAVPTQPERVVSEQELKQAIQQINQSFAGSNEAVSFTYEEKLGQLFVQITDNQSGEVIREVPSKEFIQHQVAMKELVGLLLDKLV